MRCVVVTGMSAVTPLGSDLSTTWQGLINGKSGITRIPNSMFVTDDLAVKIAGIVGTNGDLDLNQYVSAKEQRKMDRFIHLAIVASVQAIRDSGWEPSNDRERYRTGVLIGSGIGGLIAIEQNSITLHNEGPKKISPFFIPASLINLASGRVAIMYNFKGPNHAVVTACATGSHAIGDAARIIADGDADVMVCGGTEAAICRLGIAGFAAARALSTRNDAPEKASRPWDKDRDGFVMGEGAGILVLEEYEHAKKRGANIYGEIIGYGMSGDAYHITAPDLNGDGGYRAMKIALTRAQLNVDQIDYINAHGTSTPAGDMVELSAVKRLFGESAYNISMSSTKSAIGHLLGAAGSVEAIFSIKAMCEGIIPPTINLDNPDKGCDIDLVPNTAKEKKINTVLSNSFGFGGTNASLVFRKI
ncbi:MAG: beta-ketoacyl-ACP synthase II [Candidatus Midichloria sp.]|nr:MAG: beta-ketoacyl-ACP synthase II [Candidatus Midichloria sp.]